MLLNSHYEMAIDQYLREIGKYPLLDRDQELELARKARAGDSASRDLLINSNLRLVVSIAKGYLRKGVDFIDLIGEGNEALTRSADRYDPERHTKFASYAYTSIERKIWRYLRKQRIIQFPEKQDKLMRAIYNIRAKCYLYHNEEPSMQFIAGELNEQQAKKKYTKNDVREALLESEMIYVVSLNNPLGNDGPSELINFIAGNVEKDALEDINEKSIADKIRKCMQELDIEELGKQILEMHLNEEMDFKEIAKQLGTKPDRIEQLYRRDLRQLKLSLSRLGINSQSLND